MDRLKVLEMIGRHLDVGAWRDRVEIETRGDLAKLIFEGRRRAGLQEPDSRS